MPQRGSFSSTGAQASQNPLDGVVVELDGVVFACKGRLSILHLSELAAKSVTDGIEEAATVGAIYQTLSLAFGPDVYPEFRNHVRSHATPDEVILGILQFLNETVQANIERITARPTGRPSSSSAGPKEPAGLPVRSISADRTKVTVTEDADGVLAARLANKQPANATVAVRAPARAPKTRPRAGTRRTG